MSSSAIREVREVTLEDLKLLDYLAEGGRAEDLPSLISLLLSRPQRPAVAARLCAICNGVGVEAMCRGDMAMAEQLLLYASDAQRLHGTLNSRLHAEQLAASIGSSPRRSAKLRELRLATERLGAITFNNLGELSVVQGRTANALEYFTACLSAELTLLEGVAHAQPSSSSSRSYVRSSLFSSPRPSSAPSSRRRKGQGRGIGRRRQDPRVEVATTHIKLCSVLNKLGHYDRTRGHADLAVQMLRRAQADKQTSAFQERIRVQMVRAVHTLAASEERLGNREQALPHHREAHRLAVEIYGGDHYYASRLADVAARADTQSIDGSLMDADLSVNLWDTPENDADQLGSSVNFEGAKLERGGVGVRDGVGAGGAAAGERGAGLAEGFETPLSGRSGERPVAENRREVGRYYDWGGARWGGVVVVVVVVTVVMAEVPIGRCVLRVLLNSSSGAFQPRSQPGPCLHRPGLTDDGGRSSVLRVRKRGAGL